MSKLIYNSRVMEYQDEYLNHCLIQFSYELNIYNEISNIKLQFIDGINTDSVKFNIEPKYSLYRTIKFIIDTNKDLWLKFLDPSKDLIYKVIE